LLAKLPHSLSNGGFVLAFVSHIYSFGRWNCACSCYHGMDIQRLKIPELTCAADLQLFGKGACCNRLIRYNESQNLYLVPRMQRAWGHLSVHITSSRTWLGA
jgi:hypothetical protein